MKTPIPNADKALDGSKVLVVRIVVPQSLAQRLGVLPGDQILSINGFAPGDALVNQRSIATRGGRLSVVVDRQGTRFELGDRLGPSTLPGLFGHSHRHDGSRVLRVPLEKPDSLRWARRPGPDLLVDLEEIQDLSGYRVRVRSVTPGGQGSKEGLKSGDIIDSINGAKAKSLRDVRDAYYYRNGQITITFLRGAAVHRIALHDRDSKRQTLGLTCILTQKRQVKVTGADQKGLGAQMGIAQRGTVITKVNGDLVRTPADIKRVDQAIIDGRITDLQVEFTPPGGKPQIARRAL